MRKIRGKASNAKKNSLVFAILGLTLCLSVLFSVAYQKGRAKDNSEVTGSGHDYLYDIYEGESGSSAEADASATVPERGTHCVLVLGKDYDSNRTDSIICVSFGPEEGAVSTLQIPRDTYVIDGDYSGRINTLLPRYKTAAEEAEVKDALEEGIYALMDKIKEDFGISCDNYLFLDSGAVATLTDALGGVTVDIPLNIDYTDKARGIDLHLKEGVQRLDGVTAAQFIRYRQGYPQADLGRIDAQKLYCAAMLDKLGNMGSTATVLKVITALSGYVKTDLTAEEIVKLGTKLCLADGERVVMYTLPGNGVTVNGASYYGAYKELLWEIVCRGFGQVSAEALEVTDFYTASSGGYTDTEGVKLSSILDHGIAIPVYAS